MVKILEKAKKLKTKRSVDSSSCEENEKGNFQSSITSSSDDEEANADLSLEIIEKAKLLTRKNKSQVDGEAGIARETKGDKYKEKKKRKKVDEGEVAEVAVDNVKDERNLQTDSTIEISGRAIQTDSTEVLDNAVMRKLLRGPRYFDPPDNSWGACYNCGEEGHTAINCTSARRQKPCFVCGSFEHNARQCSKGRDCFICKQQGHRAKDCPEKNQTSKICIKCGDLGHNMFVCSNSYSADDLKDIQCYVCKNIGHLCCVNYVDPGPRELSCYRCGLSGHSGLACSGSRIDSNYSGSASSCYKCGAEGHFARECTSSIKTTNRNNEFSTPKVKAFKKKSEREHKEVRSAPPGIGKTSKMKRNRLKFTPPARTKHRGGWITDDPGEFLDRKFKQPNWRTPKTQKNLDYRLSGSNINHTSSSHTLRKHYKPKFNHSASNDSVQYYQHRYSASRNGNSSGDWFSRNYNHW